eukprot:CAMPEP_0115103766 /NCGR_PEP_ID=MMETSP0227-20121206/34825_1 /TAXON_ID=89957 /ORGANISM="Polarella glacialis, Strain CCMP 1383" /LENGTH=148 /DNA_ID=CAMNT_0002500375 /DNA_START=108 /DNA_END=554 /DNA_ORIENTATION=+
MATSRWLLVASAMLCSTVVTAGAFAKGGRMLTAAAGRGSAVYRLQEPSSDDLLADEMDAEEGDVGSGTSSGAGCASFADENRELLGRLVRVERMGAEQDSALAKLKRAVRELREAALDAETAAAVPASADACPAVALPPAARCQRCAA